MNACRWIAEVRHLRQTRSPHADQRFRKKRILDFAILRRTGGKKRKGKANYGNLTFKKGGERTADFDLGPGGEHLRYHCPK